MIKRIIFLLKREWHSWTGWLTYRPIPIEILEPAKLETKLLDKYVEITVPVSVNIDKVINPMYDNVGQEVDLFYYFNNPITKMGQSLYNISSIVKEQVTSETL